MIFSVILLFSLAVIVGLYLTFIGVRYQRGSMALGLLHAGIAVLALILLTVQIFRESVIHMLYNDAEILFIMAMTGGLAMLALRKGKEKPPMIVVSIHGFMALLALMLLMIGYSR